AGDGGFGYDPIFRPDGDTRSAAELTPAEKDAASHRGRALVQLVPALAALAG
ncbi:nucleoside-triphosphate diphosphatase, partial [Rhodococcus erythropolis]